MKLTINILCGALATVTVILFVLAAACVVVFPWFNKVPIVLFALTGIVTCITLFKVNRKPGWQIAYLLALVLGIAVCSLILNVILGIIAPRQGHEEFISPSGSNTIILEYDYVSRPFVYQKDNNVFMSGIQLQNIGGSNETIKYYVVWLSDKAFELTNSYGEKWYFAMDANRNWIQQTL